MKGTAPQHLLKGGVLSAREGRGETAAGRMHGRHQCFPWHLLWLPSCLSSCSTAVPCSLLFLSLAPKYLAGALFSSLSVVSAQSWDLNATYMLATLQTSIFLPDLSSKLHSRTSNCQTDHSSFTSQKYRRHDLPQTELCISPQTSPSRGFPILVNGMSTCPGFQNKYWEVSLDSPSPSDHDHLSFL